MRHFAILVGAWLIGCSGTLGDDADQGPGRGTSGGVCYGNDTCNAGLVCIAKVCVESGIDGGVDGATSITDSATTPSDSTTTTPPGDTPGTIPTFEGDIIPMFNSSCGGKDNACHSRVAYHPKPENGCRGWLSLENAALGSKDPKTGAPTGCPDVPLYDRLTKLDAWECGDPFFPMFAKRKYIEAGKPATSHALNKMNGGAQCGVPNTMPKGGMANAADIDKLTRWIKAGAPR